MLVSVPQAQIFFLALTRILALIIHVPVLGGPAIPNLVKIGLGLLLAMVMVPWQPLPPGSDTLPLFAFGLAIGQEVLIGTLAGFASALTFGAIQIAGEMMVTGTGFSAGRIFYPDLQKSSSMLEQLFFMATVVLFLVINGHHLFLIGLQKTFTVAPLNTPLPDLGAERLLTLTSGLIAAGVQIALPVLGALLLTDLTLGLLARVAPQIQVFFLGMPLKIGVGLLAIIFSLNTMLPILSQMLRSISIWTLELLGG